MRYNTSTQMFIITAIMTCIMLTGCSFQEFPEESSARDPAEEKPEPSAFYKEHMLTLLDAQDYLHTVEHGEYITVEIDYLGLQQSDLSFDEVDFVIRLATLANLGLDADPTYDEDIHQFFLEHTLLNQEEPLVEGRKSVDDDTLRQKEQAICGGTFWTPAKCESWSSQSFTWSTEQEVINYLYSQGFHKTAWYASGSHYDYTLPVAWPCGRVYRLQAIIEQRSPGVWSYRDQHDLNPEIYSWPTFPWPVPWWGVYVSWWHRNYC